MTALVLLLALVFGRLPVFFESELLKLILHWAWLGFGLAGFVVLIILRPLFASLSALFFVLLYLQSYASLYQPSLAGNLPKLDYIFFGSVSANYCFDLAIRTLSHVVSPFLVFSAAFACYRNDLDKYFKLLFQIMCAVLLINLSVIAVQGLVDIRFLAAGSGSAVETQRAAGLLEDSGASTIAISSLTVFLLVAAIWELPSSLKRNLAVSLLLIGILVGSYTGGRSYFALLMIGLSGFGLLLLYYRRISWKFAVPVIIFVAAGLGFFFFDNLKFFAQGIEFSKSFTDDPLYLKIMGYFDPLRAAHIGIFLKAIPEYWPTGIGMGGSHITLAQYGHLYEAKGIPIAGDAPLNYFVAMILELGVAGALLLASLFLQVVSATRSLSVRRQQGLWPIFFMTLCLLASFGVGSQLSNRSLATLTMFCIAFYAICGAHKRKTFWLPIIACGLALAATVALRYTTRPLVPSFFWAKQGRPQMPLSPQVPIAQPKGGRWMMSGTPFAISEETTRIFVELPPEYYPQKISVAVFDSISHQQIFHTEVAIEIYDSQRPGRVLDFTLKPEVFRQCGGRHSSEHFCYMIITNNPEWEMSKGVPIGFSLINTNELM